MHSMEHIVGFIPIARTTFDIPLATQVTEQARQQLLGQGLRLVDPGSLVTSQEEAVTVAGQLAAEPLDALVIFQATFADSSMIMTLVEQVDAPVIMWAVPERPNGGRLRLNSLCGINLGGHALTRAGYRYDYVYAEPDDQSAAAKVVALAQAGRVRRLLQGARIGRIGENPDGFESCLVNWQGLKQTFGVDVIQLQLEQVFSGVRSMAPETVDTIYENVAARVDGIRDMEAQEAIRGTMGTYATLRKMAEQDHYAGLAVRCWPQFFTELGCAACGALSLLNDEQIPAACETDVNGTVTQMILQWLSNEPVFGTDMVSFDRESDAAVLWHCGKAPLSMADPSFRPRATIHSNRKLPLLMEFPLKPGRVTVARLSEANGAFRLVVGGGEMLPSEINFSGTSGLLRFDRPVLDVLDTIIMEGLEHHVALTYGDHVLALESLAKLLNIPVLHLS